MSLNIINDFSEFLSLLKEILDNKKIPNELSELSKFYKFLLSKQKEFEKLMSLKIDTSNCSQINDCTSCDFKNISYSSALAEKHKSVLEVFKDMKEKPKSIISSPKPFSYRKRAQFHIDNFKIGYHKRATNDLVEIKHCPLLNQEINEFLLKKNIVPNGKIEIEVEGSKLIQRFIEERGNSFSQINESVNTLMKLYIYKLISNTKAGNVLELYGGTGNFIEYLIKEEYINKIVSVDLSATNGVRENGKLRFINEDVGKFLSKANSNEDQYDLVLLDPPRKGIQTKNLEKLLALNPKYIIYVACEQSSLKIRANFLINNGWEQKEFVLFDMFPFTKHIESVSFFVKK